MKALLLFLLLALAAPGLAQQTQTLRARWGVSADMGVHFAGQGFPRIYVERQLAAIGKNRQAVLGVKVASGLFLNAQFDWSISDPVSTTWVPVGYLLTGRRSHHFELGLGPELWLDKDEYTPVLVPFFEMGYRYQRPEGGLSLRVRAGLTSGLGLGLGYAFPLRKARQGRLELGAR
jgi:hypothetical protein